MAKKLGKRGGVAGELVTRAFLRTPQARRGKSHPITVSNHPRRRDEAAVASLPDKRSQNETDFPKVAQKPCEAWGSQPGSRRPGPPPARTCEEQRLEAHLGSHPALSPQLSPHPVP